MKKLAIILSLALSATAFACPNMDHDAAKTTTAKSDKPADQKKTATPAKEAPKADTAKAAPAKDATTPTKPDKVSSK
ncbi:MAG: hypothetical protein ABI678_30100 [Kofleriaceae bacterium]